MIRTAWTRKGLRDQHEAAQELARDARRQQVLTADGTPEGDRESAMWRTRADQEEERAARITSAERRPAPLRTPVRPAPYIREGDRAHRREVREARRERRRKGEA